MKTSDAGGGRGLNRGEFKDKYGTECSIQDSSAAFEPCIWLGVNKVQLNILAREAAAMGRADLLAPPSDPERMNGWVEWRVPEGVTRSARMHLTQEMAADLLPLLEHFVKHGRLP